MIIYGMKSSIEIILTTFVNPHLFWIIPKKNLLIRSALNRVLQASHKKIIKDLDKIVENEFVAVNVDGIWCRAIIDNVLNKMSRQDITIVCWLPDYGVMRAVNTVYELPKDLKNCPHLAKQASLHNVINLSTDFILGENGYELTLKKTTDHIKGVVKIALDCIESAEKLYFSVSHEDDYNIYGDIICENDNIKQSLTNYLIQKNLIIRDQNMFKTMECSRKRFRESYFKSSQSWCKQLDKTEKSNLDKIIFNKEQNKIPPTMEFFERKPFNDMAYDP